MLIEPLIPHAQKALLTFGTLFAIVDPFAVIPAFLSMTPRDSVIQRRRTALVASVTTGAILMTFAVMGMSIFKLFGVTLPAFQIAGGLILLLAALDQLRAKKSPLNETVEECEEGANKDDVAITPLAIPMLSGPGAITTVIVLYGKSPTLADKMVLMVCIAAVALSSYVILYGAAKGSKRISPIAMNIVLRLTGLMIAAIGIQFILSALKIA